MSRVHINHNELSPSCEEELKGTKGRGRAAGWSLWATDHPALGPTEPIHVVCTGELIVYVAWPAFWNRDSRETDGSRILLRTARVRPSRSSTGHGDSTRTSSPRRQTLSREQQPATQQPLGSGTYIKNLR